MESPRWFFDPSFYGHAVQCMTSLPYQRFLSLIHSVNFFYLCVSFCKCSSLLLNWFCLTHFLYSFLWHCLHSFSLNQHSVGLCDLLPHLKHKVFSLCFVVNLFTWHSGVAFLCCSSAFFAAVSMETGDFQCSSQKELSFCKESLLCCSHCADRKQAYLWACQTNHHRIGIALRANRSSAMYSNTDSVFCWFCYESKNTLQLSRVSDSNAFAARPQFLWMFSLLAWLVQLNCARGCMFSSRLHSREWPL